MREIYAQMYGTFCCWDCLDKSSIQQEVSFSPAKNSPITGLDRSWWFQEVKALNFFHQQTGLKFMGVKCFIWSVAFVWRWNLETLESRSEIAGKFLNVLLEEDGEDQLDSFCGMWRSIVKQERNIVQTIKRRNSSWIGHILRRNCLLRHVIEGSVERRINIVRVVKWRRMRWGRREARTGCWWANLRERGHWGDPDVDGRIILTHCGPVIFRLFLS
jgi:hypothetical protein